MIFTRTPTPGKAKTRLIPALGAFWAAEMQQRMTRHLLHVCDEWAAAMASSRVEVWLADEEQQRAEEMFGAPHTYRLQCGCDLGERLAHAFQSQPGPALAVGADCPEVTPELLSQAASALQSHDVVLGPADDGGYYLIGMKQCHRELFEGIPWGTSDVLAATMRRVESLELQVCVLPTLTDVDELPDLPAWLRRGRGMPSSSWLSVIIPTRNEADCLPRTLATIGSRPDVEVIVADGGSGDHTCRIAEEFGAAVVPTPLGRAVQLNCGAAISQGDLLLFLHADTLLPPNWYRLARQWEADGSLAAAFQLSFDSPSAAMSVIASGANWRARYRSLPYGDQGLLIRRQLFGQLNGYRLLPAMEDYELIHRLRKMGRIDILPAKVTTSARRYLQHGPWRTVLQHQKMIWQWRVLGRYREECLPPSCLAAREPKTKKKSDCDSAEQRNRGDNER